jgi:predicted DNA-binding transcriptional regulator
MTSKKSAENIKGTTLEVYHFMLKANKPLGIREIQRSLKLSSPSLVQYHIAKLEQAELVKRNLGNYVVNKVLLEGYVKISRFVIPRYTFYSVFMAVGFFS